MNVWQDLTSGPCRVVAEVGGCGHDLATAHDLVDAVAAAGAWGYKVQLYSADGITTRDAQRYDGHTGTQHEAFDGALPYDAWDEVRVHCAEAGLTFFASVFDFDAIEACEELDVPLYKVASCEITNRPLLSHIAATGKPVLLSTGGSTLAEVLRATEWLWWVDPTLPVVVMACSLSYPTSHEDANVSRIETLRHYYPHVGYSNHTQGYGAAWVAAALGAVAYETHFTLTPGDTGDDRFAADPEDLALVVDACKWAPLLRGSPVMAPTRAELPARRLARRSIVAAAPISEGQTITGDAITFLRPGTGIPPYELPLVLGAVAAQDIAEGEVITHESLGLR